MVVSRERHVTCFVLTGALTSWLLYESVFLMILKMTCLCCLFQLQVNSIAIFLIGGEQNGTWTNQTCIINPKMKKSIWLQAYGMREVTRLPEIVVARGKDLNQGFFKSTDILNFE